MAPPRTSHLLLFSPDLALGSSLGLGLLPYGLRVRTAQAAHEMDATLRIHPYDLLLLAGESSMSFCRQLRVQGQTLPIIVLVEQDDVPTRVNALDAGASDVALLPIELGELLPKIRSQLLRTRPVNPTCLQFQDVVLNLQTHEVWRGVRAVDLTTKEYDLLKFLLENPHQTLSREQILTQVWGEDFKGESNIIEVYIRYLRLKLEREGEKKLIQTVRGVGYTLRD